MRETRHDDARSRVALLALVVLGAALRLYGLDRQSLWNDELSSWAKSRNATWQQVVASNVHDVHPPGHVILLHFWTRAFGDSETMLRLPSALAGIALTPAMFVLGKRLYGPAEGLIAAAIAATAWVPIFYSQEARAYSFLTLFVALSSIWLIDVVRALRSERRPPVSSALGYVVAAELACSFHYYGVLFVALQAGLVGSMFLRRPAALMHLALLYALVLLGYLPWLGDARTDLAGGLGWLRPPGWLAPLILIHWLFNGSRFISYVVLTLYGSVLIHTVATIRRYGVRRFAASADALLLAWLVVPVAIVFVKSLVSAPAFGYRYFVIVAPAAYLLAARGVTLLPVPRVIMLVVAAALPALLLHNLVFSKHYYTRPAKQQFREAAAYVVRNDGPKAKALILACAWSRLYFDYYFDRLGSPRRVEALVETATDRAKVAELVAERSPDDVWLLAASKRPAPELIAGLEERLRLVEKVDFYDTVVWHFAARNGRH